METLDAIKARHSTRNFNGKPVSDEQIVKILEAADAAPIGMGKNDTLQITVIKDPDLINEFRNAGDRDFSYGAPVLILVSTKDDEQFASLNIANASCVIENMLIEATDLDLQSIYLWGFWHFGLPKMPELQAKLNLPEGFSPMASAAIGYADDAPAAGGHTGIAHAII